MFKLNHTYFNVAAGQISHFGRVSLLDHTDLEGSNNNNSQKNMCENKKWQCNGKRIQTEMQPTFTDVPQPTMRVVLSFQHRLQGYMSGLRSVLSRSTLVIRCLVLKS